MDTSNCIYVAGHRGLVGSAIVRCLRKLGFQNILTKSHVELDLLDQGAVRNFFSTERPEYVFLAAAKVGGIHANNTYPADFIRENLLIQTNVIDTAWRSGVKKLCFLGSSCIYPRFAPQPIQEKHLLTGPLEPTNEPYAVAKIAGIKMCQSYRRQYGFDSISLMPTNLYGPEDNFDLETSHVIPALLRKFHEAKKNKMPEVVIWGSGTPRREFMHVDDMASASVYLMQHYNDEEIINIGVGQDVTISELGELIGKTIDYPGRIVFDASMPDGMPRKLLNVSKLESTGWRAKISLPTGLAQTYRWYLEHVDNPES